MRDPRVAANVRTRTCPSPTQEKGGTPQHAEGPGPLRPRHRVGDLDPHAVAQGKVRTLCRWGVVGCGLQGVRVAGWA